VESPPGVSNADNDPGDNRDCVTFDSNDPEKDQTRPATLSIVKTANPTECTKDAGAGKWSCGFKVIITNNGTTPFNDQVVLTDETKFPRPDYRE
jgi:hypothetical protein